MIYQNIDKITFNLLKFKNFNIRNVINLSSEDLNTKERKSLIRDKTYPTKRFSNINYGKELTIDCQTYITLSTFIDRKKEVSIYLSYQHLFKIKKSLKEVEEFLDNDVYTMEDGSEERPFIKSNKGWEVNPKFEDVGIKCDGLVGNKSIQFILDTIELNNKEEKAITFFLNEDNAIVTLKEFDFRLFTDFICSINLLQITQNNINLAMIIDNEKNQLDSIENGEGVVDRPIQNLARKQRLINKKKVISNEEDN
jgi:hypothetical protein